MLLQKSNTPREHLIYSKNSLQTTLIKKLWIAATVLTLLVMLSRMYLGVHWPLDVLIGGLLGLISAVICYQIFKRCNQKTRIKVYLITAVLCLTALFFAQKSDTVKSIGACFGFAFGALFERKLSLPEINTFESFETTLTVGSDTVKCSQFSGKEIKGIENIDKLNLELQSFVLSFLHEIGKSKNPIKVFCSTESFLEK